MDTRISNATDDQLRDWLADIVVEDSECPYWATGLINDHIELLATDVMAEAVRRGIW